MPTLAGRWADLATTPADAVSHLRSGMRVYVHGITATPTSLLEAMVARRDLEDISLYHAHTTGPAPWAAPAETGRFHDYSIFVGDTLRQAVDEGRADFIPVFLSDCPGLFKSGRIRLDAALLQLSPPDRHGNCTLGSAVEAAKAPVDAGAMIIAEINEQMPRTHGNTVVPLDRVTAFVHTNRPLYESYPARQTEVEARIGELIADLVEDGSTLQIGIGAIPEATLARLGGKCDLGIHSEMFSDALVDLFDTGAITNRLKSVHPGRIVASFVSGTRRVYDFIDDNPLVQFYPADHTNDTAVIRKIDKMVAINSALQIDLTGQVSADSIGHRIYSGIGGQLDFMRGAALSRGGKPVLAISSMAGGGRYSRIVTELLPGSGVVTTRGHVHWIVTEYGAVDLFGLPLRQRGEALISIAHPDVRADLRNELKRIRHF